MTEARVIERFKKRTIWFHWIHTAAFLILVITGAILFFPGLGGAAEGGLTRLVHRVAVLLFIGLPIFYIVWNPRISWHFIKETITWNMDDFRWICRAPDYYFGGDESKMLPQGHVNTGQKLWQLIILATGVLFIISGFAMWFLEEMLPPDYIRWSVIVHDVAFLLALLMTLVHIYTGVIHPRMTESLRSMWDGKISPSYARNHYSKWYEKISNKKD